MTAASPTPAAPRTERLAARITAEQGGGAGCLIGREASKRRAPGPVGQARRVLETVSRLPRCQQQRIIEVVEALAAHTAGDELA